MAKNHGEASYLEKRKSMLDAYNVAAATNPGACHGRVVKKDAASSPKPESDAAKRSTSKVRRAPVAHKRGNSP